MATIGNTNITLVQIAQAIEECERKGVPQVSWFEFNSSLGNLWFDGGISWEQKELLSHLSWELKNIPGIEYVFGGVLYDLQHGKLELLNAV